jgi:hypothetical protein
MSLDRGITELDLSPGMCDVAETFRIHVENLYDDDYKNHVCSAFFHLALDSPDP